MIYYTSPHIKHQKRTYYSDRPLLHNHPNLNLILHSLQEELHGTGNKGNLQRFTIAARKLANKSRRPAEEI